MLRLVSEHLDMDVAFLGRLSGGMRTITHIDAGPEPPPAERGDTEPADGTYCQRVIDGQLRAVMCDTDADVDALALPVTQRLGIRSYVGTPVVLGDGSIYGTLCAYSEGPDFRLAGR